MKKIRNKIRAIKKKSTPKSKAKQPTDSCWDGYKKVGMKIKKGGKVPNCVPQK